MLYALLNCVIADWFSCLWSTISHCLVLHDSTHMISLGTGENAIWCIMISWNVWLSGSLVCMVL
jgi:hypothetical protein